MKVSSILATKGTTVETIGPDSTVERAAQRMRASHLGALVVSTDGTHYLGLISERDIVYGFGKFGRALFDMHVGDIMHKAGPRCSADDTVEEVMAQMTHSRVRHLPVLEGGELRGIVSIGDVVKNRLDETAHEMTLLRDAYLARG